MRNTIKKEDERENSENINLSFTFFTHKLSLKMGPNPFLFLTKLSRVSMLFVPPLGGGMEN